MEAAMRMLAFPVALGLLLPSVASAAWYQVWERGPFDFEGVMDGTDGWEAGFEFDPWYSSGDLAFSYSDYNNGDTSGSEFGSGWAADNWLIRGESIRYGRVTAYAFNEDDDTVGVVSCHNGSDSFYLFGHSADSRPPVGAGGGGVVVFLAKIVRGEVVEVETASADRLNREDWSKFELIVRADGIVRAKIDDAIVLEMADTSPLEPGKVGFYAYDSGYDGYDGGTNLAFQYIQLESADWDSDGVIDDEDNCIFDANADQKDTDGDSIGDVCDDTPGTDPDTDTDTDPDTDTDTDTDPDTDTDTEPDTEPDPDPEDTGEPDVGDDPGGFDEGVTGARCGCVSPGAGAAGLPLLLMGALLLRRRRDLA